MTKEDVEDTRGGEQDCWFGEGECHESSEMESGSWRDCWQSGVNPATPVYRDYKPGSKLDDDDDDLCRLFAVNEGYILFTNKDLAFVK